MRLPFLTSFLLFIIILSVQMKRNERKEDELKKSFWDRELAANSVRKKNIDSLPYIQFDPSSIPAHTELGDERVNEYLAELSSLSGKRILNCTGKSNTDLKLEYGAPNITKLTEYDGNYTILVRSLARLAEKYLIHSAGNLENISTDSGASEAGNITGQQSQQLRDDALKILEYGISVGTDVRLNYELLARLYMEAGNRAGVKKLKESAESINSLSKEPILRMLDRTLDQDS